MTKRERDLLCRAAEALDDGTDPFANHFLAMNSVNVDEAIALADNVAACIRACVGSTTPGKGVDS
jgi:hypothetical protein